MSQEVEGEDGWSGLVGCLLPDSRPTNSKTNLHESAQVSPDGGTGDVPGQVMSADGSCQNAVDEALVTRLRSGMDPGSASTSAYCQARVRVPQWMVSTLARQSAALLNESTPQGWLWRGWPVKLVDGTTAAMPDTPENQARLPQPEQQPGGHGRVVYAHRTNTRRRSTWQDRATDDQAQTEPIHVLGSTALESQTAYPRTWPC